MQYHRHALTSDFASYCQAWWAIGHGVLDPYSTGFGVPFWRNNAEFAMWPLALLYHVYSQPIVLLWVQDLAVVVTEIVVFRWIVEIIKNRKPLARGVGPGLTCGAAVVLVANPWVYETTAFDFHFEALAALFVVLAGRDLWAGRTRRLWLWVPLALASTALGGIYLVGLGISGLLAGRRTRKTGALIAAMGLAWITALTSVGGVGVGGRTLSASYGYLAGGHHRSMGMFDVVVGVFAHLGPVAHMVAAHFLVLFFFLAVFGLIGVTSPWGLGMALVVLGPNLLDARGIFIRYAASFQSWPALPFVLVGSVMVLMRLLEGRRLARRVATGTAAMWATVVAVSALVVLPTVPRSWLSVDSSSAAVLAQVQATIPPDAEVIASQGVVGRFGARDSFYAFHVAHQQIPVDRRLVVFVLTTQEGIDDGSPSAGGWAAISYVGSLPDVRALGPPSAVKVFVWSSHPGTKAVTLP